MFENILGQERLVTLLQNDLNSGTLPSSLLFYGEKYSAKLSTALELARVLSCKEDGAWNCSCRSCREARLLISPYTVILGNRYFEEEIAACGDALLRQDSPATRYLYIRAVRKLTRRFDPFLWEGNESKLKGVNNRIEELDASLDLIDPSIQREKPVNLEKILKKNSEHTAKIASSAVPKTIPIDQVRNVAFWSRSTGSDHPRIIIMEGAEQMADAARNALLKLLEEPPENCYLILTSSRKGGIIQTVLSRLRQYPFVPRSREDSDQVLRRIFRVEEPYDSLRSFFLAWKGVRPEILVQAADTLIKRILEGGRYEVEELEKLISQSAGKEEFEPFLEELTERFRLLLCRGELSPDLIAQWNSALREAYMKRNSYNQSTSLLLESLFYRMAAAYTNEKE